MTTPTVVESQLRETVSDWRKNGTPNLEGLGRTTQTPLSCASATKFLRYVMRVLS